MSIQTDLLEEIEAFVRAGGLAETTFGRRAVNDGNFVARLRGGSGITVRTVERVRAYLDHNGAAVPGPGPVARIADALDRLAPSLVPEADLDQADAFVWQDECLQPVARVNHVELGLLKGIDGQTATLLDNTRRFADSLPANNALLWGGRGMGKSSLVKAVHARVNADRPAAVALVEIHREDIGSLPRLLHVLRDSARRCLLFCDDLSFDGGETSYKSLKAVLEGGIEGRPTNVIFYATSNRRHMMPRDMIENERATAITPAEATEEKVSLSDRFGLWLGFHSCDQATFMAMVEGYAAHYGLEAPAGDLGAQANEWAVTRGARSGRVAWQFISDLAGRLGRRLE